MNGAAPGAAKSGGDKLWEDNWDDDDIDDDFSKQLRCVSMALMARHELKSRRGELAKKDDNAMQQ